MKCTYEYSGRNFLLLFFPGELDMDKGDTRIHKITYSLQKPNNNIYLGEVQFTTKADMKEIYEEVLSGIHTWTHSITRIESELLSLGFERY